MVLEGGNMYETAETYAGDFGIIQISAALNQA